MMNVEEVTLHDGRPEWSHGREGESASVSERRLVAQAKSGCSTAFGELYERHRLKVYHAAFRILRNREDAEDAAQRSFQRAFMNLGGFREDSAFSTWMTRVAINESLMLLRQRRAYTSLSESNDEEVPSALDPADERPTPEQILAESELRSVLLQAVSRLRKNLRVVVLLRELQGLTTAETAQQLGLTVSAVKARRFHARRCLRQQLEREFRQNRCAPLLGMRNRALGYGS